jgi:hypothetical protein
MAKAGKERMGAAGAVKAAAGWTGATADSEVAAAAATPVAMVPQEEMVIPAMVTQEVAMVTQEEMGGAGAVRAGAAVAGATTSLRMLGKAVMRGLMIGLTRRATAAAMATPEETVIP